MNLENGHDLIHMLAIIIETGNCNCRSETDSESNTENTAVTRYFIKVL